MQYFDSVFLPSPLPTYARITFFSQRPRRLSLKLRSTWEKANTIIHLLFFCKLLQPVDDQKEHLANEQWLQAASIQIFVHRRRHPELQHQLTLPNPGRRAHVARWEPVRPIVRGPASSTAYLPMGTNSPDGERPSAEHGDRPKALHAVLKAGVVLRNRREMGGAHTPRVAETTCTMHRWLAAAELCAVTQSIRART